VDPGRGLGGGGGGRAPKLAVMIASNSARSQSRSAQTSSANSLDAAWRVVFGIVDHSLGNVVVTVVGNVVVVRHQVMSKYHFAIFL
jgi:hypothetical protein